MIRAGLMLALAAAMSAADLADGLRLKAAGRFAEAEAVFRARHAEAPGDQAALVQLATVVGWQDRHAEAESLWRAAVALQPADPAARAGLARVLYWRGRLDAATDAAAEALAIAPDDAETLLLAGDIARARGDLAAARRGYQRAAAVAPDAPEPQERLRRLGDGGGLRLRTDLTAAVERYSAVHGTAHILGAGVAGTWTGLGTIAGGVDRRWIDGGNETTWRLGLGCSPLTDVGLEVGASRTSDRILAPGSTLSGDAAWRAAPAVEAVAGWRRSWYPGDRTDLWRPGLRAYPFAGHGAWQDSSLEARALVSDSSVSGVHGGVGLRASLVHASGLAGNLGWAYAEEAEPPRPPTQVTTWSAGLAWSGPRGGIRLDCEREDRVADWVRTAVSLGAWLRW